MRITSNEEIEQLIALPKRILVSPSRNFTRQHGHRRNSMKLAASGDLKFYAFIRQSEMFAEDFSIGLTYESSETDKLILLRCNGPHAFHDQADTPNWHATFHLHLARIENIESGYRAERGGLITKDYASYESALMFFLKKANIAWGDDDFPELSKQQRMFDD